MTWPIYQCERCGFNGTDYQFVVILESVTYRQRFKAMASITVLVCPICTFEVTTIPEAFRTEAAIKK